MERPGGRKNTKAGMEQLLRDWCSALTVLQQTDGAILCPACKRVHGRCHEAVYPLLYLAHVTGEERWADTAKRVFAWADTLVQPDGSLLNDPESDWKGTTAFGAIALVSALSRHGDVLDAGTRAAWTARLAGMGRWLFGNLRPGAKAYINYYAANACAMALLGDFFKNGDYISLAKELLAYCLRHLSGHGLLLGEGRPHGLKTPKGCGAADIGYNLEESLPCLYRAACALGDQAAGKACRDAAYAHLLFLLPDGGIDNSFGTRAFKWTYWGSRTADGCTDLLCALGREERVFAEAAWRHTALLRKCTHAGLLDGGPDYRRAGEAPCVHHTFCQAKSLAFALDDGLPVFVKAALPAETGPDVVSVPELALTRLRVGGWIADVTAYDAFAKRGAHVSGGTMSLLWHEAAGPVFAAGPPAPGPFEPLNEQPLNHPERQTAAVLRLEAETGGGVYASCFDTNARVTCRRTPRGTEVTAEGRLRALDGALPDADAAFRMRYELREGTLDIDACVSAPLAETCALVLPVISGKAQIGVERGRLLSQKRCFSPAPGFLFTEYRVQPDGDGLAEIRIRIN